MSEIESLLEKRISAGTLRAENVNGNALVVSGWVYRYRDQGGVIFIDLRDRSGVLQVVFDRSESEQLLELADQLRGEDVILVEGTLRRRSDEAINSKLPTGEIELVASQLFVLSKAIPSPIPLDEFEDEASEENRLKYRFLDLRRLPMQQALKARHDFYQNIRNYLDKEGFWEVETPILNKSTPEGARDFLVPSRINPGEFYALPQSPQIFKQILMTGQVEKYYQIARCFRDEDLRKDRQPEFTQIDIEMSFITKNMIMKLIEKMIAESLNDVFDMNLPQEIPQMSYRQAIEDYGSDRPDIRYDLKITPLDEWAKTTEFKVFKMVVEKGGRVRGLRVPGGATLSRKDIDDLTAWVAQDFKAKGLAWVKHGENGLESVVTKFLPEAAQKDLIEKTGSVAGDIIFFAADTEEITSATLGAVRQRMAEHFKLIPPNSFKPLWVVDFPLFIWDEDSNGVASLHHPFTAPVAQDRDIVLQLGKKAAGNLTAQEREQLLGVRSDAYDYVINGVEIGGGSIRIHDSEMQQSIFRLLNISDEEATDRFGFLLEALKYGAPPHGGIAFGTDRMLMLALDRSSIRDVIAFPKTQRGQCLMSNAPSQIDEKQLRELKLRSLVKKG